MMSVQKKGIGAAAKKTLAILVMASGIGSAAVAKSFVIPGDDAVIASRGGVSLTLAELDARIMELPAHMRAGYLQSPERIEETVSSMLLEKQLAKMAMETPKIADDPYLNLQLEQAKTRMLAGRASSLPVAESEAPDFELLAKEAYQANPQKYAGREMVEVHHILISNRGRDEAAARALAEKVRKEALAGTDFKELIAQYTDEMSRGQKSDGNLGKIFRGMMVPEFETAAFALKAPGDISEVVKTKFGYHVIRLDARGSTAVTPFEQVKAKLVDELRKKHESQTKQEMIGQLRSMKLEASPEIVASLRTRYSESGPITSVRTGTATSASPKADAPH